MKLGRVGIRSGRRLMHDLLYIGITLAFFALSVAYVKFCDRVK